MRLLESVIIDNNNIVEIIPEGTNVFLENLEAKKPHLLRKLEKLEYDNAEEIIDWIAKTDPVAVKTNNRKTPFINQILNWFINGVIRLPEDIETTKEVLIKYNESKQKGQTKPIDSYDHPGAIAKELDLYKDKDKDKGNIYNENAKLIDEDGEFKLYRIDNWDQGEICFADSGWCVQHIEYFEEYGPPYYMVTKGNKRYALMHKESGQIKDVYDEPLTLGAAKPIEKFIKKIWPKFEKSFIDTDTDLLSLIKLWPDGLDIIMKDPESAYLYAKDIIKGRWPEAEPYIIKDPKFAYLYAYYFGKKWPEAEPYIMKDPEYAYYYAKGVLKRKWPEAEPYIMKDPEHAYYYAKNIIKERWPEAEPHIIKDPKFAYLYAADVIKGRWPEAEPHIMTDPQFAYLYAADVIKGRWPEAEPYVMTGPLLAYLYAANVIKGKWPEAEPHIMTDPQLTVLYNKL